VNRPGVLKAAYFACLSIDEDPTVRNLTGMVRKITGKGMRTQDVMTWLKPFRETLGKNSSAGRETQVERKEPISETIGKQTGNLRAGVVKVLELEDNGDTSVSPSLVIAPETIVPLPPKPAPMNSVKAQRADTDFEAFELEVAEVVILERTLHPRAATASEKVVRQRLTLLWRKHGDDAFAKGLEVALGSGKGLDYGRGAMERYEPGEGRRSGHEPNASDLLPTLTELIAAGKVEPMDSAAIIASRPDWFNAELAARA
jgi:hypothetical protein